MVSYRSKKQKQGVKFRISFVLLFIFASFAACFSLYMRQAMEEDGNGVVTEIVTHTAAPEQVTVPVIKAEYSSTADVNPLKETVMLDKRYFDSCMFAGDSLIVGLGTYGIIPEEQVAAKVGMSVMDINTAPLTAPDGTETFVRDKINEAAPENLYVLLGLNLLGAYTDEQLLAAYGDFIDSIDRSKTRIYILSVPPVTAERESSEKNPILNSDIDAYNADLLKFANNRGLYYVDINSALKGEDGKFPEELAEADGIHFKKSTYDVVLEYILTHVYLGD